MDNIDRLLAGDDDELAAGIARLIGSDVRVKPTVSAFSSEITVTSNDTITIRVKERVADDTRVRPTTSAFSNKVT